MRIEKLDGGATVRLSEDDCALLAKACQAAGSAWPGDGQGVDAEVTACDALGACFAALAVACVADAYVPVRDHAEWHGTLERLGLDPLPH